MKFSSYTIKSLCILSSLLFQLTAFAMNDGDRYTANSVLSKGNWYKVKIGETGIYKLTYEDLKKIGLSNPKNVQVYGYGGWIIDQDFREPYIDDLPQVGIWMSNTKENFGSGDYILFYGRGDIKWTYNSADNEFVQTQNPYSFDSYYFVTESTDKETKLIEMTIASPKGNNIVTTYQDYYLHEKEWVNIAEMGRQFFGEDFKINNNQTFNIQLPGITSDQAKISYSFVSRPPNNISSKLEITFNGKLSTTEIISIPESHSSSYIKGKLIKGDFTKRDLSENNTLVFKYSQASSADKNVKLDYFRVTYTKTLKPYGAVTPFRSTTLNADVDFQISNIPSSSNILIFDVTDPISPLMKKGVQSGSNYTFNDNNSTLKEYVMVDPSKAIPTPTFIEKVKNQNLHGLESAEMIIIVQPFFYDYAKELADMHYEDSGLISLIVYPEDIYNEFSSGKPDISAYRRFTKMFYDRATSENDKPKYLLLFGDGTYDNRLISSLWEKEEKRGMLLTYQTEESTSETESYVTDDYIGFLDDNEGVSLGSSKLDIGIGRLPVRTLQEASSMISKIKRYMSNPDPGIWQNNFIFVADDAVASKNTYDTEIQHMRDMDSYTELLKKNHPEFIANKIYSDAYERVRTANGYRYPTVKEAILKKLNEGASFLTFSGHGSPNDWTHEYILTQADIEQMSNTRLPVWLTATCDFMRFDQDRSSGGESALLNPNGGAIALFSTTRVVYIANSATFCTAFFKQAFKKEDGLPLRLGDIIRLTKQGNGLNYDSNKLKYLLFGDPALRINYPKNNYKIEINTINGDETSQDINIQALSPVVIKGSIKDEEGNVIEDFNGNIESIIFDSEQTLRTRGHLNPNRPETPDEDTVKRKYLDFTNTVYNGTTTVKDGEFEISFVVPKDILYSEGYGKMNFFATDTTNYQEFAHGSFLNYTVNGTNSDAIPEEIPPSIDVLYLNRKDFKDGGTVNSTPLFYAEISDNTGINLAGGIGHAISLTIDDKTNYDLTASYRTKVDSPNGGAIYFQIPKLSEGKHSLQFRAWDVWNNSVTRNLEFYVSDDYKPSIYEFSILGSPAKESVKFMFTCDTPGSSVKIKYAVYSMDGRMKWEREEKGAARFFDSYEYEWDLRDVSGNRLPAGVYICRVLVSINGEESSEAQRFIVLGQ